MKASINSLLFAALSAMMVGCTTQQVEWQKDKLGDEKVKKMVGSALKDASASCSADWCWVVVRDVQTGEVLFADGVVHDVNIRVFGVPEEMNAQVECAKADLAKRLSDSSAAGEPEAGVRGMRMDTTDYIYTVYGNDSGYAQKASSVAVASGFALGQQKGPYYVAVCFAVPKEKGDETAKNAARAALLNICSDASKAL